MNAEKTETVTLVLKQQKKWTKLWIKLQEMVSALSFYSKKPPFRGQHSARYICNNTEIQQQQNTRYANINPFEIVYMQ